MNTAIEQARLIREDMLGNPRPNLDLSKRVDWKVIARACVTDTRGASLLSIDSWRYLTNMSLEIDKTDTAQAPEIFNIVSGILAPKGIRWDKRSYYKAKQIDYETPDIRWVIPDRFSEDGLSGAMRLFWPVDVETAWRERYAVCYNTIRKTTIGAEAHQLAQYLIGNAHDWRYNSEDPYPGIPTQCVSIAEKIHECNRNYWTHMRGARSGRKLVAELKKII
jgi:hypothetical protein